MAIANWEAGGAAVWDVRSGSLLAELAVGRHGVVQFSPDGRLLAATPDGVTLWHTDDWRRISQLGAQGTTPAGLGIAFSPDSRVLAVGQINGVLGLFDPVTGDLWAGFSSGDYKPASTLAFSPDQRQLIAASTDERSPTQVWDLIAMRSELAARGLDLPADMLARPKVRRHSRSNSKCCSTTTSSSASRRRIEFRFALNVRAIVEIYCQSTAALS